MGYTRLSLFCTLLFFYTSVDASTVRTISMKGEKIATAYKNDCGEIFVRGSVDGGKTWQGPLHLYWDNNPSNKTSMHHPQVEVSETSENFGLALYQPPTPSENNSSVFSFYLSSLPSAETSSNLVAFQNNSIRKGVFVLDSEEKVFLVSPNSFRPTESDLPGNVQAYGPDPNDSGPFKVPVELEVFGSSFPDAVISKNGYSPCLMLVTTSFFGPEVPSALVVSIPSLDKPSVATGIYVYEQNRQLGFQPLNKVDGLEKLNNTNQIELVGLDDISYASLIWRNGGTITSTRFQAPEIWRNGVTIENLWNAKTELNGNFSFMGGIHLNTGTKEMSALCSNVNGQLKLAYGSLENGLNKVGESVSGICSVAQVSTSNTKGDHGWWLVLGHNDQGHNDQGQKELILVKGDSSNGKITERIKIADNFKSQKDHNIAMAVGVNESTGDVVAIFDIISSSPTFEAPFNTVSAPGTFVLRVPLGDKASATIEKLKPDHK